MKVKISKDGEEKEIEIKMKGRHAKAIWKKLEKAAKSAEEDDIAEVIELKDYFDELACELTGMSAEELEDLDIEEKQKITGAIQEKARNEVSFMKPLQNQAS